MNDKTKSKRAARLSGHGPHKLLKMERKKYSDKKKEGNDDGEQEENT